LKRFLDHNAAKDIAANHKEMEFQRWIATNISVCFSCIV
jgi:hypothetical protein